MRPFAFYTPGNLQDRELELVLDQMQDAQASLWQVPAYLFHMRHRTSGKRMGNINLRFGGNSYAMDIAVKDAARQCNPEAGFLPNRSLWQRIIFRHIDRLNKLRPKALDRPS